MLSKNKIYFQPFMIVLIFALPILISWMLFHYHDHFHFKKMNHGTLVNPPINVNFFLSSETNHSPRTWHVIHVEGAMCDASCEKMNYLLLQVGKALGKDQDRVEVTMVAQHFVLLKKLQTLFEKNNLHFVITNKIYLIDPQGNLFMYYPDNTDPMNVLKDLKRVLEVSQIG